MLGRGGETKGGKDSRGGASREREISPFGYKNRYNQATCRRKREIRIDVGEESDLSCQ